jgi:hypothetical protein
VSLVTPADRPGDRENLERFREAPDEQVKTLKIPEELAKV